MKPIPTPFYHDEFITLYNGHALYTLEMMADESISCVVTSPPYWGLRDYGVVGQLGLESTFDIYIQKLMAIFKELKRVLRKDGTLWLNLGDSYVSTAPGSVGQRLPENDVLHTRSHEGAEAYKLRRPMVPAGLKPKDLVGIPWRVAFALQSDGWYLRQDIIWHKRNPMPESVKDRPTKSHEYIFLMSKSRKYYYDWQAIKEPASYNTHARVARARLNHKSAPDRFKNGIRARKIAEPGLGIKSNSSFEAALTQLVNFKNKRSVWSVATKAYKGAHFATFPEDLIKPCILSGAPSGGIILDPFSGAGTTLKVARDLGRKAIGIELKKEYCEMTINRLNTIKASLNN